MFYEYSMTLRELIQSVDAEAYASIPLYEELLKTKPEFGSSNRIMVKVLNGEIAVSNVHVGSLGDIVACPIDVAPDLQITKMQLLDAILKEMSHVWAFPLSGKRRKPKGLLGWYDGLTKSKDYKMMELFDEENAYTALADQWENYGLELEHASIVAGFVRRYRVWENLPKPVRGQYVGLRYLHK